MKSRYAQSIARIGWLIPALLLAAPFSGEAQVMTSTNYRIPFDAFSDGGGRGTSSGFIVEDTITEQASPSGEGLTSTNFRACVGYECLKEAPFMTVTLAVQSSPCSATSSSAPPYAASLGTLTPSSVSTSADRICVRVSSNTATSVIVEGSSTNTGLASVSTPSDKIASTTATLTPGVSGYGYCSSNAQNGFTASAPFNGSCDLATNHSVGGMTAARQAIWTASGPITNAFGELLTKASISTTTPAHGDYQDTLTLTVTGTY